MVDNDNDNIESTEVDNPMKSKFLEGSEEESQGYKMDLPDIERDSIGIPTFVFRDELHSSNRPTANRKNLEVVMLWNEAVISVGHYSKFKSITCGESSKNDFRLSTEAILNDSFSLIDVEDDKFVINWNDNMKFKIRSDDHILTQEDLIAHNKVLLSKDNQVQNYQYKIDLHDRIAVQIDDITFVIQYVAPVSKVPIGFFKTLDYYFAKVWSLSFVAHISLLLVLYFTPVSPKSLDDDLFKNPNRFAQLILKEPEKRPPKKKFDLSGSKGGARHKGEEGKFGKPKKNKKDALASTKGAPVVDVNKREKDRKIALKSGLLAALGGAKGPSAVSNVFGPGGLGTGINNALGGLRGTAMGDAGGAGGMGYRGTGAGGGGSSLGIGGLGSGSGRGTGGLGKVDLGGRGKSKYKFIPGRTVTKGCLSAAMVRRVISRVQSQARHCYEKGLKRNPNLSGKVTTNFTIGSTGRVTVVKISESTMQDETVHTCLKRVVKHMSFPPCQGGGTANVTYPWIFKSGG